MAKGKSSAIIFFIQLLIWVINGTILFVKDACFLRLAVDYKDKDSIFAMMDVTAALQNLSTNLSVEEKSTIKKELSAYLNYLLINDFAALVQILYRVDVSEQRLKTVLKENKEADAGDLLTELIIQRQEEKSVSRRGNQFPVVCNPITVTLKV